jgi:hypothetical protein
MIAWAHKLDAVTAPFAPALMAGVFIFWLLMAAGMLWTKRGGSPLLLYGAGAAFGLLVVGQIVETDIVAAGAAEEVGQALALPVSGVTYDGKSPDHPWRLIEALRELHDGHPDHSRPREAHEVVVQTARGPIRLVLSWDSKDPESWWVYYPRLRLTRPGLNEIGHIVWAGPSSP